jgi:putative transposase
METMKQLKAFKFQLKTNAAQEKQLRSFAGCCRLVWNKALALQKERLDNKQPPLSYPKMAAELVRWKYATETAFLSEAPSQPLQQTLKNLDRALRDAFNKKSPKRFPSFKKKGMGDSFRYPQGFKIDEGNSRLFLPKIGWINYRNSRMMEGTAKNITLSENGGVWFVSIQTEQETEQASHQSNSIIGLDMGIAKFSTLSDGTIFEPANSYRTHEKKLKRLQRQLSRKKKFSNTWKKQKGKLQKTHTKIANIRRDYLHKTSTTISKNHAVVVIENLQVANMSATAKGTAEQHGKNVKTKAGLNKSILDQGWYEFRRQLEYKQAWRGGMVIAINPRNTSRTCACCGHIAAENRTTQSCFHCVSCGHTQNADINAAQNILAAGHAVLACGEVVRPWATMAASMKHEPTEKVAQAA